MNTERIILADLCRVLKEVRKAVPRRQHRLELIHCPGTEDQMYSFVVFDGRGRKVAEGDFLRSIGVFKYDLCGK